MIILAADTCWHACSAALAHADDGRMTMLAEACEPMQTGQAERLPSMIAELFDSCKYGPNDIGRVAVPFGPGSFTGVRIGISMARAVRLATRADVVTCSSLEVIARSLDLTASPSSDTRLLVAMDARRHQVYVQWFTVGAKLEPASKPELVNVAQLVQSCAKHEFAVAGTGAQLVAVAVGEAGGSARVVDPNPIPNAKNMIALAARAEPLNAPLEPIYLRPPDAKPPINPAVARI